MTTGKGKIVDYYKLLDIPEDAGFRMVIQAFSKKINKYSNKTIQEFHKKITKHEIIDNQFSNIDSQEKELNNLFKACNVLTTNEQRRKYDMLLLIHANA